MIFKQFYLTCLAHASYRIADQQTRTAAVVDPQRDVERYMEFAAEQKVQIKHVILTHLHAILWPAGLLRWWLPIVDRCEFVERRRI
jgi:hypothetical protein